MAQNGITRPLAMLVRNVGHLMTNPAILLKDGREIQKALWMPL